MSAPKTSRTWLATGFIVLLIGAGWTVHSLRHYSPHRLHLDRKLADLQRIASYQESHEEKRDAVRAFDALPAQRPPELAPLLREHLPGIRAEVRRRETAAAWGDWQVHRMEVSLDDVPLERLGFFISLAETQRPPWRLIESNIRATDQRPGHARATVVFEALSK